MKAKYIGRALAMAMATVALASCESNDQTMPSNPTAPAVGPEVSTTVIYQANPRFFASSDCLKALKAQVKDIADMGCDVLWVMPVQTMGEKDAFGSPYCIRDFRTVNTQYGTAADFKDLVSEAHSQGMKVIIDWVANHTAWDHTWITEHPEYYVTDAAGNIQQASVWTDVAQLNFNSEATVSAMIGEMRYWVEEMGVDGFRCDHADGPGHAFWSRAIASLREGKGVLLMLAEGTSTTYYQDGFDMIYDWDFAPSLSGIFTGSKPSGLFTTAISSWNSIPAGGELLRYVFNHDYAAENSIDGSYGSFDAIPAAYVLTALLHGTPMIYSSMDAEGVKGRLSFMTYNPLTWSASRRAEFKAINAVYKATAEVRRGELASYNHSKIVAFTRTTPEQTMLVVVNTSDSEQTVKTPITLAGETMTELFGDTKATMPETITLGAYGYKVYLK